MKKLTIIIPLYNEESTILQIIKKIENVQLISSVKKEIVIIDDCSSDRSGELVTEYISKNDSDHIKFSILQKNSGKGATIRKGISAATGDFIIIQDADLEYDPKDYNSLLEPIVDNVADVVYGSRFMGKGPHRKLFFWHSIGNKFLTFISNIFTNLNLTDMETCYKLFRADLLKSIKLEENGFGFEPEVTAKISQQVDARIYEVGISYYGRTYSDGKKIDWKDGIRALYCIFKYNIKVNFRTKPD